MGKLTRKKAFTSIIRIEPPDSMWHLPEGQLWPGKTNYYVENLIHVKGLGTDICLHFILHHCVTALKCMSQNTPDYLPTIVTKLEEVFSIEVTPTTDLYTTTSIGEGARYLTGIPGEWMRGVESILKVDPLRPFDSDFQMKTRGIPKFYEIGLSVFALTQSVIHLLDKTECRILCSSIRFMTENIQEIRSSAIDKIGSMPYMALDEARSNL